MDWAMLITNIVLAGVTFAYVILTGKLATSSKEAAESALRSAQAAERTVALSMSTIEVDFHISPTYLSSPQPGRPELLGLQVRNLGATVYVHGARLVEAYFHESDGKTPFPDEVSVIEGPHAAVPTERPADGITVRQERGQPTLLHRGETVWLDPVPDIPLEHEAGIAFMSVEVLYSFEPDSAPVSRLSNWVGREGLDHEVLLPSNR